MLTILKSLKMETNTMISFSDWWRHRSQYESDLIQFIISFSFSLFHLKNSFLSFLPSFLELFLESNISLFLYSASRLSLQTIHLSSWISTKKMVDNKWVLLFSLYDTSGLNYVFSCIVISTHFKRICRLGGGVLFVNLFVCLSVWAHAAIGRKLTLLLVLCTQLRGGRGQRFATSAKHPRAAWIVAGSLNYRGQPELTPCPNFELGYS